MKDFYKPRSLQEALASLDQAARDHRLARLLAGGTDLIIALRDRKETADLIIDVSDLPELRDLSATADQLHIGAGVSFARIEADPLIKQHIPMLAEVAASVGAPAIRSRATMGGNVANGAAAADSIPVLLAADAMVRIASAGGDRIISVEELLRNSAESGLRNDEILIEFMIPLQSCWTNSFEKIGRRKALAIARINLGMMLDLDPAGEIRQARVAIGCVGKKCYRVPEVEAMLTGRRLDEALRDESSDLLETIVETNLNGRKTAPYKKQIAKAVLARALDRIMEEPRQ